MSLLPASVDMSMLLDECQTVVVTVSALAWEWLVLLALITNLVLFINVLTFYNDVI